MNIGRVPDNLRTTRGLSGNEARGSDNGLAVSKRSCQGIKDTMKPTVMKKSLAVLASGAALFLTLGAGCNGEGGNENEDRPGVEQENEQDGGEGENEDEGDN